MARACGRLCIRPMKDSLRQQLERLTLRLSELDANLADSAVVSNIQRYRAL